MPYGGGGKTRKPKMKTYGSNGYTKPAVSSGRGGPRKYGKQAKGDGAANAKGEQSGGEYGTYKGEKGRVSKKMRGGGKGY